MTSDNIHHIFDQMNYIFTQIVLACPCPCPSDSGTTASAGNRDLMWTSIPSNPYQPQVYFCVVCFQSIVHRLDESIYYRADATQRIPQRPRMNKSFLGRTSKDISRLLEHSPTYTYKYKCHAYTHMSIYEEMDKVFYIRTAEYEFAHTLLIIYV